MIFKKQAKNKKRGTLKSIMIGIGLLFIIFVNLFTPIQKAHADFEDYRALFAGSKIRNINTTEITSDIQINIQTSDVANYDKVANNGTDPQAFVLIARNQKTNYDYQAVININTSATVNNISTSLTGLKKGENYSVGVFYRSDEDGEGGGIDIAGISTKKDYYLVAQTSFVALGDQGSGGYAPSTIENGNNSDNAPKARNEGTTGLPICSDGTFSFNVPGCIAQGIYYLFFVPTSFIFSLSGQLLDWTMDYSLDSDSYNSTSFVAEGWKITRDLSNMLFIFILLYTAIGTILGIGGVNAKQTIIKIVLIALFINFSLFFSQIIIDASNIVGRIFYESMGVKKGNSLTYNAFQDENTKSISVAIVSQFNPQNLFQESEKLNLNTPGGVIEDQNETTGTPPGQFAIISLIMSAINLVGAYIFFVVAFLFIGRVVGLWLAMIMAPIAFISFALPGGFSLKGFGLQEWWSKLVSMAFVVPVFLFFMYLIIKFLRVIDLNQIIGTNSFTTTQVIMATCIPLVFIVILLMKAKSVAISMSGEVAEYAMKGASFVGGLAVGAATGGAAWAGRKTLGAAASRLSESSFLKDADARGGAGGFLARRALSVSNTVSNSTFDARNAKIAGKDIASATGFSVGKVDSQGYNKDQAAKIKAELEHARSLEAGQRERNQFTTLQNNERRLGGIGVGQIDPRTGQVVTQANIDAARVARETEERRLNELNARRRQGYANVAEQGDGIDYVFNRIGRAFAGGTTQLEAILQQAEQRLQVDNFGLQQERTELARLNTIGINNIDPRTNQQITQATINAQTQQVNAQETNVRQSQSAVGIAQVNVTNNGRGPVTTNQESAANQVRGIRGPAAPTDQTAATNALNQTIAALTAQLANQNANPPANNPQQNPPANPGGNP